MLRRRFLAGVSTAALLTAFAEPVWATIATSGAGGFRPGTPPPPPPPPPPGDPIAQVLDTMQPGEWKELTVIGSSWGGIAAAQQPLTLDEWDPGGSASPVTWSADNQVAVGGGHFLHGVFDFSGSTVRTDGMVIHNGGGHQSGGDNAVLQFSSVAACNSILGAGGSRAWTRLLDGGTYLPQANVEPSWSAQQGSANWAAHTTGTYLAGSNTIIVASINTNAFGFNGGLQAGVGWTVGGPDILPFTFIASIAGTGPYTITLSGHMTIRAGTNQPIGFSTNSFWANTTARSPFYQRLAVGHTYWYNIALGTTGYWALAGVGGWDPNFGSPPGPQAEIVKDDGTTNLTTTMPNVSQRSGYGIQGLPLWCDLDNNVYCWQGAVTVDVHNLFKITNPTTTTPTLTDLGLVGASFGTGDTTQNQAVMVQWPVATIGVDPGKRGIFAWRFTLSGTYVLATDITGTPGGVAAHNFASTPSFPAGGSNAFGLCFDSKRSQLIVFNGLNRLGYIYIDPVFPQTTVANASFVLEGSSSVSGDAVFINGSTTQSFNRIEYLPVQDAYVASVGGHVWLRKPVSTAVGTGTQGANTLALTSLVGGVCIGQTVSLSGVAVPSVLAAGTTITGISGSTITISTPLGADLAANLVLSF